MAFGGLKGTLVGGNNSIPNPLPATGSVAVVVGDLIVAVIAQQTALTVTAVTDNLGNTYTAQNAGTLVSATISGRMFYSRVTVAGTLTTVNAATTSSTNDASISAAVFTGPFAVGPLDVNPANLTADTTTPYSCPATGTLAQPYELIVSWFAAAGNATFTAGGGFTKSVQQSQSANAATCIGSLSVQATTTQTPTWTGTAPSNDVLGTASFKMDPGAGVGAASGVGAGAAQSAANKASKGAGAGVGAGSGALFVPMSWDPANKDASVTLSNNSMTATGTSTTGYGMAKATRSVSTGGWYWELKSLWTTIDNNQQGGIAQSISGLTDSLGAFASSVGFYNFSGTAYLANKGASAVSMGAAFPNNAVIGVFLDATNGLLYLRVNGVNFLGNPVARTGGANIGTGLTWFPACTTTVAAQTGVITANFGITPFAYGPVAGFSGFDSPLPIQAVVSWLELEGVQSSGVSNVGAGSGAGAAAGIGSAIAFSVGAGSGNGKAAGVASSVTASVGAGSGSGTAAGVASGATASIGSASGAGTAAGAANANVASASSSSSVAGAAGIGAAIVAGVGAASGNGTTTGVAASPDSVAAGSSTSTASAVSAVIAASVGSGAAGGPAKVYGRTFTTSGTNVSGKTTVAFISNANLANTPSGFARLTVSASDSFGGGIAFQTYFGQASTTGDPFDFNTTPVHVLFSGGDLVSPNGTLTVTSDWFALPETFDSTQNYLCAVQWASGGSFTSPRRGAVGLSPGDNYWRKDGVAEAALVDKTGYAIVSADCASYVSAIEVQAAGGGAATGISQAGINPSVGAASGNGTAAAVGQIIVASVGAASGNGTATAAGQGISPSVGAASGNGTAAAIGQGIAASIGAASGNGTATSAGRSTVASAGGASGIGAAAAGGQSIAASVGSGSGTGTAFGLDTSASVGNGSGIGTGAGASKVIIASIGAASGAGQGGAAGAAIVASVSGSSGVGEASAAGVGSAFCVGQGAGSGTATGVSFAEIVNVFAGSGIGTGAAAGRVIAVSVGRGAGIGEAHGASTADPMQLPDRGDPGNLEFGRKMYAIPGRW